jgi:hypothetical protein
MEYVSKIHAITRPSVPTSGAGMSFSGPISLMISSDIVLGLQTTPPLAPPNGIPDSAHFHVIHIASDLTSSSVTSGW